MIKESGEVSLKFYQLHVQSIFARTYSRSISSTTPHRNLYYSLLIYVRIYLTVGGGNLSHRFAIQYLEFDQQVSSFIGILIRPLGLVRIFRDYRARGARAPHISTYLGSNTGIFAQIWPSLRDFCPIFGYFVALEIEPFVRVRTCALIPKP